MELLFYHKSSLLEGPVWDTKNNLIYCVSIDQGLIYQLNPKTYFIKTFKTDGNVGCIAIDNEGNIISAEKSGIYKINPNTTYKEFLIQLNPDHNLRYNDGKLDPIGRFIVGTKSEDDFFINANVPRGKLYSYYNDTIQVLADNLLISNGLGFSKSGNIMYFIESISKKVAKYHYDINTGRTSFDKFIINIDGPGYPDGMCVDIDGHIWVAEWEGGRIRKWNVDTGTVLDEIIVPCARVTSCCLGGQNSDELYITTASNNIDLLGGALFRYKLNRNK